MMLTFCITHLNFTVMKKLCYLLRRPFFPAIISILLCLPHSVKATTYPFTSTYSGLNEVPANASAGTGTITGTYDDATNTISYTISFSGLGSNTVAAHFHGPAFPGFNAPVTYAHAGFPTAVTSGSLPVTTQVITDAEETDLLAGKWYSNIHTTNFPGGEIRAFLFFGAPFVAPIITCPADTNVSNLTDKCYQSVYFAADTAGSPSQIIYRLGTTVI